MSRWLCLLLVALWCFGGYGCATGTPLRSISSGSIRPATDEQWQKHLAKQDQKYRFVVWGNHAGATNLQHLQPSCNLDPGGRGGLRLSPA
jgi:hypothetical protein